MKKQFIRKTIPVLLCIIALIGTLAGCGTAVSSTETETSSSENQAPMVENDFAVDTDPTMDSHLGPEPTAIVDPNPVENAIPVLKFSRDSGVYPEETLAVKLTAPEGYTIAFRTDGTFPTASDDSRKSVVEVELSKNTAGYLAEHKELQIMKDFPGSKLQDDPDLPSGAILCAALVDSEGTIGDPEIKVYYLGLDFDELFPGFLVLSVATDPANLLDYERGILATGAVYDAWRQTAEGKKIIKKQESWKAETNSTQRGFEWERPCILQIYDEENTLVLEQAAGIRTRGGMSRRENQKSFNLYFRPEYGEKCLNYELFPETPVYKSFTLNSGGNSANTLKYKNTMLQELASDRSVLIAAFRPAVLFLNGEYWGPYTLTEKVSAQMIHDHYGVEEDQVVVIKEGRVEVGMDNDLLLFEELMSFADKDLTQPEIYEQFCSAVDVNSFADFCAIRVFIGDTDWYNQKNTILWRTRDTSYNDGRWQYVLYDIEFSSGLYSDARTAPTTDHYHKAIDQIPLFAAAIQNDDFYALFLNSLMEIGNENYSYEKVSEIIQAYDEIWRPLMDDYYKRFGSHSSNYDQEMKNTLKFFKQRYSYIIPYLQMKTEDMPG